MFMVIGEHMGSSNSFLPVYGYWRDDNEDRRYVLDREEMQREFDYKLNKLEEERII